MQAKGPIRITERQMRSFPLILSFILVVLFGTAYAELSFPPFESFDKDGNGRIEATEMGLGLVKLLGNGIIKNIEQSLPYQARDGEIDGQEYEEFERGVKSVYQQVGRQLLNALQREFGDQ